MARDALIRKQIKRKIAEETQKDDVIEQGINRNNWNLLKEIIIEYLSKSLSKPIDEITEKLTDEFLFQILGRIGEIEYKILIIRFALYGRTYNLKEIAKELKISKREELYRIDVALKRIKFHFEKYENAEDLLKSIGYNEKQIEKILIVSNKLISGEDLDFDDIIFFEKVDNETLL